eukprot:TRINITY_DN12415_c1_g1_i1.p1 TRINITY_DN12415_c1_g1~~TRINITY_DN12415_c1_g1_i1.p1  ORF type:complete len:348 (+),score=54.06 TRINITY_DN12415_c1_g1_i1:73-1116(+)
MAADIRALPFLALAASLASILLQSSSKEYSNAARRHNRAELPAIPDQLEPWDPVEVNYTRRIRLDKSSKVYTMRTIAMNPPIFEIEDFLTDDECDTIMNMAVDNGLAKSDHTFLDGSNYDEKDKDTSDLSPEEAMKLFRYSEQTWLDHDSNHHLRSMFRRLQRLARLPHAVMDFVEQMQVVKYRPHGHYESHFDSEADHLGPCCVDPAARGRETGVRALDRPLTERCRLCRYMTVLYYLVDTEEGGGTVFPLADLNASEYEAWSRSTHPMKYKQTQACAPGKVVYPKRGKAVMWYNHHVDRGWLGGLHERSLHGGCNVIKGRKWIANHWISYIPHPDVPRTDATGHV